MRHRSGHGDAGLGAVGLRRLGALDDEPDCGRRGGPRAGRRARADVHRAGARVSGRRRDAARSPRARVARLRRAAHHARAGGPVSHRPPRGGPLLPDRATRAQSRPLPHPAGAAAVADRACRRAGRDRGRAGRLTTSQEGSMSRSSSLTALALVLLGCGRLSAQQVPYGQGRWEPDSTGNERAVVRVADSGAAVRVRIPWRRRDEQPEAKRIVIVAAATGVRVANVMAVAVNREYGDLVFEPTAGPGDYYVYYMPYQGTFRSNYPRITYRPPDSTAAPAWLARWRGAWAALPPATVSAFQAVDSMSGVWPMEVIATRAESETLAARHQGMHFLLFPEDRTRPIRMSADLPYWWIEAGANGPVTGSALRGEFYAFQIGVWAVDRALDSLTARFGDLAGPGAERIPATAFSSFNTGGVDWQGRTFTRWVQVGAGKVQALWCGVMVPDDQAPGDYEGRVTVSAAGLPPETLLVRLTVSPHAIAHHGDDEPWRLSRLRWLDSRLALDTGLVRPYTPVAVDAARRTVSVLGRTVALDASGFPRQVTSWFTEEMTAIGRTGRPVLRSPIRLVVEDSAGRELAWRHRGVRFTSRLPGAAGWEAVSTAGATAAARGTVPARATGAASAAGEPALTMRVAAQLDFDGNIEYTVTLTAAR